MNIKLNKKIGNFFDDASLWVLILSNALTIFFAIRENWNLSSIMWVYWFQSIVIGFFNFLRIFQLEEFSTDGFKINGKPTEPTKAMKTYTAFFFLAHFGFFHFVYLIFLLGDFVTGIYGEWPKSTEWLHIFLASLIFFMNHLFSHIYNRRKDTRKQNIGALMFYPYARIIPMHFTIIIGSFIGIVPVFLFLKTLADGIMHVVEHRVLRLNEEPLNAGIKP